VGGGVCVGVGGGGGGVGVAGRSGWGGGSVEGGGACDEPRTADRRPRRNWSS